MWFALTHWMDLQTLTAWLPLELYLLSTERWVDRLASYDLLPSLKTEPGGLSFPPLTGQRSWGNSRNTIPFPLLGISTYLFPGIPLGKQNGRAPTGTSSWLGGWNWTPFTQNAKEQNCWDFRFWNFCKRVTSRLGDEHKSHLCYSQTLCPSPTRNLYNLCFRVL